MWHDMSTSDYMLQMYIFIFIFQHPITWIELLTLVCMWTKSCVYQHKNILIRLSYHPFTKIKQGPFSLSLLAIDDNSTNK
jgi:hypothetical protein